MLSKCQQTCANNKLNFTLHVRLEHQNGPRDFTVYNCDTGTYSLVYKASPWTTSSRRISLEALNNGRYLKLISIRRLQQLLPSYEYYDQSRVVGAQMTTFSSPTSFSSDTHSEQFGSNRSLPSPIIPCSALPLREHWRIDGKRVFRVSSNIAILTAWSDAHASSDSSTSMIVMTGYLITRYSQTQQVHG